MFSLVEASFRLSLFVIQLTYLLCHLDWNLINVNGKRILKPSCFNCLVVKFTEPWRKFFSELWECCRKTAPSASANHLVRWKIRKLLCKRRSGWDCVHCYVCAAGSVSLPMRKCHDIVIYLSVKFHAELIKINYFIRNKCESHDPFLIRCLLYSVGLFWHDNIYSRSPVKKENA
jgi:hypothetical protein